LIQQLFAMMELRPNTIGKRAQLKEESRKNGSSIYKVVASAMMRHLVNRDMLMLLIL
jgi:hypothetical protein